jgi:ligand-binding sensor domain-containing protein
MITRKVTLLSWAAWSFCAGANLQPADLLFISTHRNPTQVSSDDRSAYVLTEGGVLLYDYRRRRWMDNIAAGMGIKDMAYNPDRNLLRMLKADGTVLEYNPAFRRVQPSSDPFQPSPGGTVPGELNGLSLGGEYAYLGEAGVRDRYNRRAAVTQARVFDYDHLWLLTAGHGPFLGSLRRKEAESVWFGLHDPAVTAIYAAGKDLWFGSSNPAGALVRAKSDLTEWKVYPAQQDYEFPDGHVRDLVSWRNHLWLATAKGVARQDLASGRFRFYRRMLGTTDLAVFRLHVHGDRLYAGTEKGVASLAAPEAEFKAEELPVGIAPAVADFFTKDKDLWAATGYGLFIKRKDGWKSFKDVTPQDVPEGYGVPVTSVGHQDTSLYFADANRVIEKPKKKQPKTLFDLEKVFRLIVDGSMLYAGFDGGVRAYNLKTRLWVDFRLEDGIPGNKVQSLLVREGYLWIGTDLGVMRVKLKPYLPS